MPSFHHVNLGVLPDQFDQEVAWLTEVLGYRRVDPGPELTARGANWYEGDDGGQVHLSRDEDHRPAARAHLAVEMDTLGEVEQRLRDRAVAYEPMTITGTEVLICLDPAGNRWELRAPSATSTAPRPLTDAGQVGRA
jgi:catechol 2,3-dioxygenase-like lactoylglutathione lyase family enzyme